MSKSKRVRKTHAEISVSIDGIELLCQVPYRYLNQVAATDAVHSDKDYVRIAQENIASVESVVRGKMASHVPNTSMRLERSDFPPLHELNIASPDA